MIRRIFIRFSLLFLLLTGLVATAGIGLLLESKEIIFKYSFWGEKTDTAEGLIEPFPVSVDVVAQVIEEDPTVEAFFLETLAESPQSRDNWWNQVAAVFSSHTWFQNLASPVSRIMVIWPGERKEEVAKHIGHILRWNDDDRARFQTLMDESEPLLSEGKYFPGQYVTHRRATPEEIHQLIYKSFETEVLSRYTPEVAEQVPLVDALIIASLIEREANTFENKREVSGVIWNRLFIEMPLQLDASLQYVRGSRPSEASWWPAVKPSDKFISSPFNTYENAGLPPAPIANPSTEAIVAALNPIVTECLFYFHTKNGDYHCSETYEEHVEKLKSIYGRGV